jgi:thiamine biosynthesis lipoprotein
MQPFLIVLMCLVACVSLAAEAPPHLAYTQPTMGTLFRIELYAENNDKDKATIERAVAAAFKRIDDLNAIASDYLPESELSRLNREPANKPIKVSADLYTLLAKSLETARLTDGAFDVTATYAIQQWRRAKRQKQLPTPEQTQKAIAMTDWRALQLNEAARTVTKLKDGLLIDLGGIGKGYAADAALTVLKSHGITRALVAGSGDLAIGDAPPGQVGWDIALRTFERPEDKDTLIHVTLANCGCSTSGDLHQFLELDGKRYSHIVNPRTGLGLTERIACSVIAPDATTADALATALCVLGPEKGLALSKKTPNLHLRFTTFLNTIQATASPNFPAPRP